MSVKALISKWKQLHPGMPGHRRLTLRSTRLIVSLSGRVGLLLSEMREWVLDGKLALWLFFSPLIGLHLWHPVSPLRMPDDEGGSSPSPPSPVSPELVLLVYFYSLQVLLCIVHCIHNGLSIE